MRSSARTASSRSSCIPTRTAPGAEEAFKKVNKAWDVLSDKNKRATYDNFGAEAAEGRPGAGGTPSEGSAGAASPGAGFRGAAGGFHGVPLEEILRQFQRQGAWEAWGAEVFPGAGLGSATPGRAGTEAGCQTSTYVPSCPTSPSSGDLRHPAHPHGVPGAEFPPIGTVNYWYVLLVLPLVPAQHRKQAVMMLIMYSMFGGFLL